ncbi:MAG: ribosome biogenesis GTPase Der [Deltaproteobacteria bacterium]|nr:ribosome biogenesis GTPase Der [Deltaproteobacteria bacterium]
MVKRIPLIAIVGKPNVGKSTFFNRLIGRRTAIVDDQAGVTRDRLFAEAKIERRLLRIVDTGGIEVRSNDQILENVRIQTQLAITEADLILFLLDSRSGLTAADYEVANMLRRSGKQTLVIANKIDGSNSDIAMAEFYELGMTKVLPLSAEHGRGVGDIIDEIIDRLDPPLAAEFDNAYGPIAVNNEEDTEDTPPTRIEWHGGPIRVAVVGRPNAGKSSLINRLLGQERHLVSEIPGTTRDAIDSTLEHQGQLFVFTDTAGIRRQRSVVSRIERFSVMMAMRGIESADVAVIVIDANESPSDQDARIISLASERGKGVIIVANKWDLVKGQEKSELFNDALSQQFVFASFAPIIRTSAKTGHGVLQLLEKITTVQQERHRRIGTGELNRFFNDVIADSPPPIQRGRRPKLFFVQQPLVRPPTFIFTASHSDYVRDSYKRYLQNALRKRYGFSGTPIWLKFRTRQKKDTH